MRIVLGVRELRECLTDSEEDTWECYYSKFKHVFDPIFENIYRIKPEEARELLKHVDFRISLEIAERFLKDGGLEKVESLLERSVGLCPPKEDFDVYLLIGLNGIGGTAKKANKPYIFLGLEMYEALGRLTGTSALEALDYLVPHEYAHLVRSEHLGGWSVEGLTVGELAVHEGIATLFPLVLKGDLSLEELRKSIGYNEVEINYALKHKDEIINEILALWDVELDEEISKRYFLTNFKGNIGGRPHILGYFAGSWIVLNLLKAGFVICELIKMPSDKILTLYLEVVR